MITKKLGDEIFAWNPNAFNGKGYWFVLGTKGGLGRAASRKEATRLGTKDVKSTLPMGDGSNEGRQQPSPKTVQKLTNKSGNTPNVPAKPKKKMLPSPKSVTGDMDDIGGDNLTQSLKKLYGLIKKNLESDTRREEVARNFEKEKDNKEQKKHKEIVDTLTEAAKKKSEKVKVPKKKESEGKSLKIGGKGGGIGGAKGGGKGVMGKISSKAAGGAEKAVASGAKTASSVGGKAAMVGGAAVVGGLVAGGLLGYASKVIAKEEGLPKGGKAYWDPAGQSQKVSIGFGHQIKENEYKQGFIVAGGEQIPIQGNRGIDTVLTQPQAQALLQQDLPQYEERAKKPLGDSWNKLSDPQKTALISYAYNTGSTSSLVKAGIKDAIDKGDTKEAARIIREKGIRTAGGKENKALVKRRNNEAELFESSEIRAAGTTSAPTAGTPVKPLETGAPPSDTKAPTATKMTSIKGVVKLKDGSVDVDGLNPQVKDNLSKMASEYFTITGEKMQVNSAYRSMEQQQKEYDQKGPGIAAKPGSSLHNYGYAVDINSADAKKLIDLGLMQKYGFERPIQKETWHLAPIGATLAAAKQGIFSADGPKNQGSSTTAEAVDKKETTKGGTPPTPVGVKLAKASSENADLKKDQEKDSKNVVIVNNQSSVNIQGGSQQTATVKRTNDDPPYQRTT